jgi:hypothetical protein
MAEQEKVVKSVTFTGPDGQDVTVTGAAAAILAKDAAGGRIDFDADVVYVGDKEKAPAATK